MSRAEVKIETTDGTCPAWVVKPDRQGEWPAVIVYYDAPGIRPAMFDLCQRIADAGYYVLLPDLFYREPPSKPMSLQEMFATEESRQAFFAKMGRATNPAAVQTDTGAFLDFLDKQPEVAGPRVGVTGYCMGGGVALRAAAQFPDRIAAAGAFHPGGVVTDSPDSHHTLGPKIKARVVVGGAHNDNSFTDEQRATLAKAYKDAGVDAKVELYEAAHGYVMPDLPPYDEAAAERHWRALIDLLDQTLKVAA